MSVSRGPLFPRRGLSTEDLAVGLRILADLLDAGLPLTRALVAFRGVSPGAWPDAVPGLLAAVREGRGMARALEECPLRIPVIVVGLVRAGEAGSGLVLAMRRAADHAEADATTRASIRAALTYPLLVAVTGVGALAVMLGVVLPRFAVVLSDLQQSLPPATRFVLATAEAARIAFIPGLALAVVAGLALEEALRRPDGRRVVHRFLLAVPGVGTIRWASATARLSAALGALLESGVTLRHGLRSAASAIGDAEISARLESARLRVDAGDGVGRVFDELGVMTPLAAHLVAAGEESGRLPGMLAFAARIEHARAERLTKAGVRLLEPSLILVFAGLVALVAAAMLQAVYAVRPA